MSQLIEGIEQQLDRSGSSDLKIISEYTLEHFGDSAYECRLLLCPEDGGFSAHALNLPGVVSEGDTLDEAIENIKDAFRETILSYRDDARAIPWANVEIEEPEGSIKRWIIVNV
jgi:predicted RNase H-like HicB family nuclease